MTNKFRGKKFAPGLAGLKRSLDATNEAALAARAQRESVPRSDEDVAELRAKRQAKLARRAARAS